MKDTITSSTSKAIYACHSCPLRKAETLWIAKGMKDTFYFCKHPMSTNRSSFTITDYTDSRRSDCPLPLHPTQELHAFGYADSREDSPAAHNDYTRVFPCKECGHLLTFLMRGCDNCGCEK